MIVHAFQLPVIPVASVLDCAKVVACRGDSVNRPRRGNLWQRYSPVGALRRNARNDLANYMGVAAKRPYMMASKI